jgi:hypothetical protein
MDLGIANHASLGPESGNFRAIHRPEAPNFRTVCVIGLYVGRIYDEVKGRPLCIVQGTLRLDAARQREPLAPKDGPVAPALDQLD